MVIFRGIVSKSKQQAACLLLLKSAGDGIGLHVGAYSARLQTHQTHNHNYLVRGGGSAPTLPSVSTTSRSIAKSVVEVSPVAPLQGPQVQLQETFVQLKDENEKTDDHDDREVEESRVEDEKPAALSSSRKGTTSVLLPGDTEVAPFLEAHVPWNNGPIVLNLLDARRSARFNHECADCPYEYPVTYQIRAGVSAGPEDEEDDGASGADDEDAEDVAQRGAVPVEGVEGTKTKSGSAATTRKRSRKIKRTIKVIAPEDVALVNPYLVDMSSGRNPWIPMLAEGLEIFTPERDAVLPPRSGVNISNSSARIEQDGNGTNQSLPSIIRIPPVVMTPVVGSRPRSGSRNATDPSNYNPAVFLQKAMPIVSSEDVPGGPIEGNDPTTRTTVDGTSTNAGTPRPLAASTANPPAAGADEAQEQDNNSGRGATAVDEVEEHGRRRTPGRATAAVDEGNGHEPSGTADPHSASAGDDLAPARNLTEVDVESGREEEDHGSRTPNVTRPSIPAAAADAESRALAAVGSVTADIVRCSEARISCPTGTTLPRADADPTAVCRASRRDSTASRINGGEREDEEDKDNISDSQQKIAPSLEAADKDECEKQCCVPVRELYLPTIHLYRVQGDAGEDLHHVGRLREKLTRVRTTKSVVGDESQSSLLYFTIDTVMLNYCDDTLAKQQTWADDAPCDVTITVCRSHIEPTLHSVPKIRFAQQRALGTLVAAGGRDEYAGVDVEMLMEHRRGVAGQYFYSVNSLARANRASFLAFEFLRLHPRVPVTMSDSVEGPTDGIGLIQFQSPRRGRGGFSLWGPRNEDPPRPSRLLLDSRPASEAVRSELSWWEVIRKVFPHFDGAQEGDSSLSPPSNVVGLGVGGATVSAAVQIHAVLETQKVKFCARLRVGWLKKFGTWRTTADVFEFVYEAERSQCRNAIGQRYTVMASILGTNAKNMSKWPYTSNGRSIQEQQLHMMGHACWKASAEAGLLLETVTLEPANRRYTVLVCARAVPGETMPEDERRGLFERLSSGGGRSGSTYGPPGFDHDGPRGEQEDEVSSTPSVEDRVRSVESIRLHDSTAGAALHESSERKRRGRTSDEKPSVNIWVQVVLYALLLAAVVLIFVAVLEGPGHGSGSSGDEREYQPEDEVSRTSRDSRSEVLDATEFRAYAGAGSFSEY